MRTPSRIVFVVLWVALVAEALLLSPAARPDQLAWVIRLLTGDWAGEEPLVVALFNLMGVWPFAMLALLGRRLGGWPPLWPFAFGSFALGAFSLLPGLVIAGAPGESSGWQRWLAHPVWKGLLGLAALGLVLGGVVLGDPSRFFEIWRTDQFVHIMALDFLTLWIVSVVIAWEDGGPWQVALVPLFGALLFRRDTSTPHG